MHKLEPKCLCTYILTAAPGGTSLLICLCTYRYIYTLGNSRHGIWFYRENAEKAEVYKVGGEPPPGSV